MTITAIILYIIGATLLGHGVGLENDSKDSLKNADCALGTGVLLTTAAMHLAHYLSS